VMAEIASASDQQSVGIDQITSAIQEMSEITQQNASNSEESAASALELDNLAHDMQKMVGAFKLGDENLNPNAAIPSFSKNLRAKKTKINKPIHPGFNEKEYDSRGVLATSNFTPYNESDILKDF
jgi:hypothetical protein